MAQMGVWSLISFMTERSRVTSGGDGREPALLAECYALWRLASCADGKGSPAELVTATECIHWQMRRTGDDAELQDYFLRALEAIGSVGGFRSERPFCIRYRGDGREEPVITVPPSAQKYVYVRHDLLVVQETPESRLLVYVPLGDRIRARIPGTLRVQWPDVSVWNGEDVAVPVISDPPSAAEAGPAGRRAAPPHPHDTLSVAAAAAAAPPPPPPLPRRAPDGGDGADGAEPSSAADGPSPLIPTEFICPISRELMRDPVVAADGRTYERECIELWLLDHDVSPMYNQRMAHRLVVPNTNLRILMTDFFEKHPELMPRP